MKKLLINTGLLFSSAILAVLALEFGFRLFFCEPIDLFVESSTLGYEMTPNYDGCHKKLSEFDTKIVTNSNGHRDREYPNTKVNQRILVLGDSVTFGWGVELEDSYPKHMESRLNALPEAQKVNVINAGVWGYNTIQELIFLEAGASNYQPDIVLVGLTSPVTLVRNWYSQEQGINTIEPMHTPGAGILERLRVHCKQNSHLCSFLDRRWQHKQKVLPSFGEIKRILGFEPDAGGSSPDNSAQVQQGVKQQNQQAVTTGIVTPDALPDGFPVDQAVTHTVKLLKQVQSESENLHAVLVVVIIPSKTQLWKLAEGQDMDIDLLQINRKLAVQMQENGIAFIDLSQPLARLFSEADLFLPHDFTHLNPLGHRFAGEYLSAQIADKLANK